MQLFLHFKFNAHNCTQKMQTLITVSILPNVVICRPLFGSTSLVRVKTINWESYQFPNFGWFGSTPSVSPLFCFTNVNVRTLHPLKLSRLIHQIARENKKGSSEHVSFSVEATFLLNIFFICFLCTQLKQKAGLSPSLMT